jgi:cytochrome c
MIKQALLVLATSTVVALPALADEALARSKNCLACHAVDRKLVGPSFKDISAKYASDAAAAAKMATKIQKGGSGVWGAIPMPANPQVSDAEAQKLAAWSLSFK